MICLFVLTQLTNVTDRHTDRHRMAAKAALDASSAAKTVFRFKRYDSVTKVLFETAPKLFKWSSLNDLE